MKRKPLAIDLYAGLGGWAEGFLSEGYDVIGFDIERHDYGTGGYPAQLVLQDVLTLDGSQFRNATLIVASPPCQAYSYRAMPWKRAKALPPPDNTLFDACFRIQLEACEAAGRYIPMIVENVRGAIKWVSQPVKCHFGSYYLWGDVPALMPIALSTKSPKNSCKRLPGSNGGRISSWPHLDGEQKRQGRNFHAYEHGLSSLSFNGSDHETRHVKVIGHINKRDGYSHTLHLTNHREHAAIKNNGGSWFKIGSLGQKEVNRNPVHCNSRKAASAMIAKIPFPLAQHIARCFKPK